MAVYRGGMADDGRDERDSAATNPAAGWNWGLGIALGVGIGVALGAALGNMAFMVFGIAFFPVIAMLFRSRPRDEGGGSVEHDQAAPPDKD